MKIELRKLTDIRPYENNPRHNNDAVDAVAASIREFGFRQPIVVDPEGVIVVGHTRYKAALQLGLEKVPVHVATDLTPEQIKAYRIADNKTNELSDWNYDLLPIELSELQACNYDLGLLGFDPDELARLLDPGVKDGLCDPDEVPAPPDEATTRPGDLWLLGDHRLLCGDSGKPEDVDRLLKGAPIHLVNTDPPYNVKVEPRSNNAIAAGLSSFPASKAEVIDVVDARGLHHQGFDLARDASKARPTHKKLRPKDRPLANDFVSDEAFDQMLHAWFGNLARVLLPGRSFYIWGGYANLGNYPPVLKAHGLYFSQGIVWDKQHPVLTRKDFMGCFELAFYGWKEGAAHQFFGPNNATDLWHVKKVNPQNMVHLCLHPDALVLTEAGFRAIRSLQIGDRVFAGDGAFHRVEHVSVHSYTSEHLYRIVAKGGNADTLASDNHPFLVWRPAKRGQRIIGGDVGWVRADEIRVGDYTMTPLLAESDADPFPELDEEDWFLFGLYLAQGHLQRAGHGDRRYPAFSLHKRRQDLMERIWAKWPQAREYDHNDYRLEPTSGTVVMAFDGEAGERFEALGGRLAQGKRLAPACFALPRSKRVAILQGWLSGDGCMVQDRTYWQGSTVSADLAAHLCLLAESVGYRANVYSYDPPEELGGIGQRRFRSRRRVYYLYFYELGRLARRGCPLRLEHDGREYSLRRVKRVEQVKYRGDVWNLSVEGHPSFVTAVGLSHNTEKPVELAVRAMQYSSRPGENVLDLFGGSGSTLIAAEQTGRRAFVMELDPLYCDVIVQRFEQFSGKKAERIPAPEEATA
ncbi:DNA methyltransferase [Thermogemmata fonticola]|uniref:DNA methyltransferase n=1 Tax=Thermogemmata fonticola TaxID=2755323 RepID=UPI00175C6DAA|nr:DNA methyltransferase [Thermogemmata fonticola]